MKYWQYYAIQANLMVVASLASTASFGKGLFLFLAAINLIPMFIALKEGR